MIQRLNNDFVLWKGIQRDERFQTNFSGTRSKAMLKNLLRNATNVRSREVMQQIGIEIYSLPEVDGFKHLIICIEYFRKWSEMKPIKINVPPPLLSPFMRLYVISMDM